MGVSVDAGLVVDGFHGGDRAAVFAVAVFEHDEVCVSLDSLGGSGLTSVVFSDGESCSVVSECGSKGRSAGSVLTFVSFDSHGAFG